jgi:tetratricopeptide (TPR) repeat protein
VIRIEERDEAPEAPQSPPPAPSTPAAGLEPTAPARGSLSQLLEELARDSDTPVGWTWEGALRSGAVIGRFELVREIGRGGFGLVWEARDLELGRSIAFKALRQRGQRALREERLLREADIAARLSHPNIVTLHDVGRCEHGPYLVLELLRGRTLGDRLAAAPVPVSEALRITVEIAKGVACAHARGVVHRDLKPGNVFLCDDGQVKVLDFGLAHSFGTPTIGGGTPDYMAPEQLRGAPEDERTDVFALGIILYRMLVNELPFAGKPDADGLAPRLDVAGAPALGGLLARMLESDPVKRPRDAGQVLEQLAPMQAELERAAPSSAAARVLPRPAPARDAGGGRRAWLRSRAALGAAAGVAVAIAAIAALYLARPGPAHAPAPGALPAEKRLAVLPFADEGAGADDAAFSAGLRETLTNALFQLEEGGAWRFVSAREVLLGKVTGAKEARAAFGATVALEATMRWRPQRVKVTANLVDTGSLVLLATAAFDAPRGDADALERELARRVAQMLQIRVPPDESRLLAAAKNPNPQAYELYVQGRGYLQRFDRVENLGSAVAALDRALALDPEFALAHAARAEAYLRRYDATKDERFLAQARASGERALALGDGVAAVQLTVGLVHAAAGEHGEAIRSLERAVDLEARNADAYRELANAYDAAGREREAEATYRRAIEIRPDAWAAYRDLGAFHSRHGRAEQSLAMFKRVLELTPDNYVGYSNLGAALYGLGRHGDAVGAWQKSVELQPNDVAYSNLATVAYYEHRYAEAAQLFRKALELNPTDAVRWGYLADAERWAGEEEKAKQGYRKAIALLDRQLAVNPRDVEARSRLAMHLASVDDRERSLTEIAEAVALDARDRYVLFRAALVYEKAGQRERALDAVRRAVAAGYPRSEIENAPPLAELRKDARYRAAIGAAPASKPAKAK